MGEDAYGINRDDRAHRRGDRRGGALGVETRRRHRRRQHLPRRGARGRPAWTAPPPTTWACWPRHERAGAAGRDAQGGHRARVQSALNIEQVVEPYIRGKAMRYLEEGKVVIFAAGTGNPFFTTDTAAALRGMEMGVEIVLKATKVDGVYTADPKAPRATRYTRSASTRRSNRNLKVMDATALTLCRDQKLPIKCSASSSRARCARGLGEDEGTLVHLIRRSDDDCRTQEERRTEDAEERRGAQGQPREGAHRPCAHGHARPRIRSTTTAAHADQPGRQHHAARRAHDRRHALGEEDGQAIEKAIRDSDLGLNPARWARLVRVPMPRSPRSAARS
jgi:hypothetical protein